MRPRSIDRGNKKAVGFTVPSNVGFNEAPINRPGKCMHPNPRPTALCGFNEAPINRPGKCGECLIHETDGGKLQ